ncbi:MAG: glycosyltransferase [Candidatus Lokiarchaeota archaeon]|nr:glycosyltransferase [Candidatus Lokiarchaeota archaeon]MBD3199683.1 glycosyltransferase [Candidatus Lokiarchaeota archaeon]
MYDGNKILCVAPCYNELQKIDKVVQRVLKNDFVDEMLVVDDGSTDDSPSIAKEKGATVISLEKTHGVGFAIRKGIEYGIKNQFDIIVIIAGNNKDNPDQILKLLKPITKEDYVFVQGSRFLKGGEFGDMPFYRIIATKMHPLIFSILSGKWITESTNGFRAFKLSLFKDRRIDIWQKWLDKYELEPYLYFKLIRLGYKTKEVPVSKYYPPKEIGYTKMKPIIDWWGIFKPLFSLGFGLKK